MIKIDGHFGEGGGQILRSSLTLSMITGKPFVIENIRAGRKKTGILRQHLTALRAAGEICNAKVKGDEIGSGKVEFVPGIIKGGVYSFSVGSAGSATLVLQTILPALLKANSTSTVTLSGGTHNPFAPPYDFLEKVFVKALRAMGVDISSGIKRYGFYPAGGGEFSVTIEPAKKLGRVDLIERGEIKKVKVRAISSKISERIGNEEVYIVKNELKLDREFCENELVKSPGPGNALMVEVESENITELFTSFGEIGISRQRVAQRVIDLTKKYLESPIPVDRHLADQLLIPMVMAGEGRFRTVKPSLHTTTNIEVIKQFIDVNIKVDKVKKDTWEIVIK